MALPATLHIVTSRQFLERRASDLRASVTRWLKSLESFALRFESILERHVVLCWIEFTVAYFIWAMIHSQRKQLWFEEVVTSAVDHLPTWTDVLRALSSGLDANPPLFHFLNRSFLAIFWDSPDILRLSSMIGVWSLGFFVFLIMRRNHSVTTSWLSALIPYCSGAAYFVTDATPYGLVLGFVAGAVLCWLKAVEAVNESESLRWRLGLVLALAGAVSCNLYAVLAIVPFFGAELMRTIRRFQFDWRMVSAILAGAIPVPFYLRMYASHSMGKALITSPLEFWTQLLGPVIFSLVSAIALAFSWRWLTGIKPRLLTITTDNDTLIGGLFCGMPLIVALAAKLFTHDYQNQYAITAVIGAAILIGSIFEALRRAVPGMGAVALLDLILPLVGEQIFSDKISVGRHISYDWTSAVASRPELPVVYGSPLEFVQTWFNAPNSKLRRRLTVLVDEDEARKRIGGSPAEKEVTNLNPVLSMPISRYKDFALARRPFYFVYQPRVTSWVLRKLMEDGAKPELQGEYGDTQVYHITWLGPLRVAAMSR